MSTYAITKSTTPTLITKETNWDSFLTFIEVHINLNLRIKEPKELGEATQYFTALVMKAA
jgi:DNA polymerase/3'-5' exonuclease PolX